MDVIHNLLLGLQQPTNRYVFEREYDKVKKQNNGDNSRLAVLGSDNFRAFPRREQILPSFSNEIARILSGYPQEYDDFVAEEKPIKDQAEQLRLF